MGSDNSISLPPCLDLFGLSLDFLTLCCAFGCLDESAGLSFVVVLCFPDLLNLSFWFLLISVSSYSVTVFVSISFLCASLYAVMLHIDLLICVFGLCRVLNLFPLFLFPLICS